MVADYDLNIKKTDDSSGFGRHNPSPQKKPSKEKKDPTQNSEVKDHIDELTKTIEHGNKLLAGQKSPYRFQIGRDKGEVFITLVIKDNQNNTLKTIKKNITHQEFSEMMSNIERLDGILLDYTV